MRFANPLVGKCSGLTNPLVERMDHLVENTGGRESSGWRHIEIALCGLRFSESFQDVVQTSFQVAFGSLLCFIRAY